MSTIFFHHIQKISIQQVSTYKLRECDVLSVDLLYSNFIIKVNLNSSRGGYMNLIHCFAVNVRKYRNTCGYSQEYLAELSGLHRTYISAVERERRNISIENIQRIADALNIEPYLLLMDPQNLSE